MREVAQRAGVSLGTVSNVLNRPERVGHAVRERVLAAMDELGYIRNEQARALRVGASRIVGLVVLDVSNPFFTDVGRGADGVAHDHDSMLAICNSGGSAERQSRHLTDLAQQRVQGVLLSPVDDELHALDMLREHGIPVVLVDRQPTGRDLCAVAVDDVEGGRLAAQHLLEQGHAEVAFVGGPMGLAQVTDRLVGARKVMPHLQVIETDALTVNAGRDATQRLLDAPVGVRPTAVICANDLIALGALQAAVDTGVPVPSGLAIVGYDDIAFAAAAAVPLTSVRQPREELGRAAADLLFDELAQTDHHRHRQVVFRPELIVRSSSLSRA